MKSGTRSKPLEKSQKIDKRWGTFITDPRVEQWLYNGKKECIFQVLFSFQKYHEI